MAITINDLAVLSTWKDKKKWVVLSPTGKSTVGDILFESDPYDLMLRILGGLDSRQVLLVTDDRNKAERMASVLVVVQSGDFHNYEILAKLPLRTGE